jgi:hypothetical protein
MANDCAPKEQASLVKDGDIAQVAVSDDTTQTLLSEILAKMRRYALALGVAPPC